MCLKLYLCWILDIQIYFFSFLIKDNPNNFKKFSVMYIQF